MKISIKILFVLLFTSYSFVSAAQEYRQRYDNVKDIIKTARILRGNYIPYDLQDAIKTLDTLVSEEEIFSTD